MKVEGFEWDSGNILKNEAKHGLTHDVIEAFFHGKIQVGPDLKHSTQEERHLAIGRGPSDRPMIAVFTIRKIGGKNLIRPISARFMHLKEARKYEEAFAKNENW